MVTIEYEAPDHSVGLQEQWCIFQDDGDYIITLSEDELRILHQKLAALIDALDAAPDYESRLATWRRMKQQELIQTTKEN